MSTKVFVKRINMKQQSKLKRLSLALASIGFIAGIGMNAAYAQDVLADMVKKPAQVREKLNTASQTRQENLDNALTSSAVNSNGSASEQSSSEKPARNKRVSKASESASSVISNDSNIGVANSLNQVTPAPEIESVKNINNALSMGAQPGGQCGCDPKPVVKKTVIKKKKKKPVVVAPKEEIPPLPENDGITVGGADMYHVPAGEDGLSKWKTPLTYNDIEVSYAVNDLPNEQFQVPQKNYVITIKDKRTGKPLDEYSTVNLAGYQAPFSLIRMSSDMSGFKTEKAVFLNEDVKNGKIFSFNKSIDKTCENVSFALQIKGEKNPRTYISYINKEGEMALSPSADCNKLTKEHRESTFYTPAGNLINLGFAQFALSVDDPLYETHRKISYDIHMTHSGREIYPVGYQTFLINKENQQIEFVAPRYDSKGPVFGIGNEKVIPKGDYYLVVGLEAESGEEWLKYKVSVK